MASVSGTTPNVLTVVYSLVQSIQANPIVGRVSRIALEALNSANTTVRVACIAVAVIVVYDVVSGIFRSLSWIILVILIATVFNSFQMSLTAQR